MISTASSAELALDRDLADISTSLCEIARQSLIQLQQTIRMDQTTHIYDVRGHPTFLVPTGEVAYGYSCDRIQVKLRTLPPNQCCQQLPVKIKDQHLFLEPITKRITSHCIPRSCTSSLPTRYDLGTPDHEAEINDEADILQNIFYIDFST